MNENQLMQAIRQNKIIDETVKSKLVTKENENRNRMNLILLEQFSAFFESSLHVNKLHNEKRLINLREYLSPVASREKSVRESVRGNHSHLSTNQNEIKIYTHN